MAVTVRWFAAAAEAAGTPQERVEADSLAALLAGARERHGERLARVLTVCSVLVDGARVDRDADLALPDGTEVDVLPPFAGG